MTYQNVSNQPGELLKGLLALVKESGGQMDSRVRIQKSAYLLKHLGVSDFNSAKFRYHYYGPYSRDLSSELHDAVLNELLEERVRQSTDEQETYSYFLTNRGQEWLKKFSYATQQPASLSNIEKKKLELLKSKTQNTLELAATTIYLQNEYPKLSDPQKALKRALELKPRCTDAENDARQTLKELGLAFS
jgi:uncharacterized protein YwgA